MVRNVFNSSKPVGLSFSSYLVPIIVDFILRARKD